MNRLASPDGSLIHFNEILDSFSFPLLNFNARDLGDQPLSGLTKQLRFVVLNGSPQQDATTCNVSLNTASSKPPACETDAENIWRASPLLVLRVWRNFNRLSAQRNKHEFPRAKDRQSEPSDARDPQRCNAVMRIIPARRALPFWLRIHCSADAPGNKFSSLQCHLIRLLEPKRSTN
jgi:hypothetical protein